MSARTGTLRRSVPAACLVVLGLVAAGCSDADEPGTLPKTRSPTASSSSPSPTATTPEQQVEAAVRTYYAELTRAAQTQDTTKLKSLANPACPCSGSAKSIDETAAKGRSTPKVSWTVQSINVHDIIKTTAAAEVHYDVSAYEVLSPRGKVINRLPARQGHVDLSLVQDSRGWILANVFDLEG
ncbi:MAG: hypothetical protein ACRDWY_18605 [Actinomycetes bacterium]